MEPEPSPQADAGPTRVPFSSIRRRIAAHMVSSVATSPHVATAVEIDFHAVDDARARHRDRWREEEGFGLSYLPFVAHSVCRALGEYPRLNASVDDHALLIASAVNLGIAVDLDFEGLVVPVIRDAGDCTLPELARAIHRVAELARARKLSPDDVVDGTFTITSLGGYGTLFTAPIINQPQVAILSVDGVRPRPVAVPTSSGYDVAVRPVGVAVLSFDHRAFDGAYAAAFLARLQELLEATSWDEHVAAGL